MFFKSKGSKVLDSSQHSFKNDSFENLELVETKGEALRNKVGKDPVFILFQFSGTAFAAVFMDWQFWFVVALFWIARGNPMHKKRHEVPDSCGDALNVSQDLLQWTLVFYIEQSYHRFNIQHYNCTQSATHIINICDMARQHMSQAGQWRMFRLLNAAYVLTYIGIGDEYTDKSLFFPLNEKYKLLTHQEVARIKEIGFQGNSAYQEILSWVMQTIKIERQNVRSEREVLELVTEVLLLRNTLGRLFEYTSFPMPFSYRHCISMTLLLFLPLYSYSMGYSTTLPYLGITESLIEFVYVFFFTVTCLSTRVLARKIHDPFGHDAEDFPVVQFINATISGSYKLLCSFSNPQTQWDISGEQREEGFQQVCALKQRKRTVAVNFIRFESSLNSQKKKVCSAVVAKSQKKTKSLVKTRSKVRIAHTIILRKGTELSN